MNWRKLTNDDDDGHSGHTVDAMHKHDTHTRPR